MTRIYTDERIKFLRTGYMTMRIAPLTLAFNEKFKLNQTQTAIHAALKNHKIKCGRKTGKMKGVYRLCTQEQADYLKNNYRSLSQKKLTAAFNAQFGESKTVQQIVSFVRNHHIGSGRTGRFEKGLAPWNTGTKGRTHANSTSFKKGDVPKNIRSLGAERIDNKDGYIHVKIAEQNPYTKAQTRFKQKHVVIWEQVHGPVPQGMAVIFTDGDLSHCTIDNLTLVSRAELLNLNQRHYKEMPAALKPAQMLLTKLETKIFSITKPRQERV